MTITLPGIKNPKKYNGLEQHSMGMEKKNALLHMCVLPCHIPTHIFRNYFQVNLSLNAPEASILFYQFIEID